MRLHSLQQCSGCYEPLTKFSIVNVTNVSHGGGRGVVSHYPDFISLASNRIEHLFMCLQVLCVYSPAAHLSKFCVHLKKLGCLPYYFVVRVLKIVRLQALFQINVLWILSPVVWFLTFYFPNTAFRRARVLDLEDVQLTRALYVYPVFSKSYAKEKRKKDFAQCANEPNNDRAEWFSSVHPFFQQWREPQCWEPLDRAAIHSRLSNKVQV